MLDDRRVPSGTRSLQMYLTAFGPVILECGADALDNRVEFGVWGGMTERQRRALLKQHPEVVSWADFFAAQRKHRSAV